MRPPLALALLAAATSAAFAEPYIAVQQGLACSQCHVNVTGGGMRTVFGNGVGNTALPRREIGDMWDGTLVAERLRAGGDLRAAYLGTVQEAGAYVGSFELAAANLYLSATLIPERLEVYVDQSLTGGAATREAFALVRSARAGMYLKAGRFFEPFGVRLLDDQASTRSGSGTTFASSEQGIEVGAEPGSWSLAAAFGNGAGGATDRDNGKRGIGRVEWIRRHWRLGGSVSENDLTGNARRSMLAVHGAARLGSAVVLIVEHDWIEDRALAGNPLLESSATHAELRITPGRGISLAAWAGRRSPSEQAGLLIEYTPYPALQLRAFYRLREGTALQPGSGDDELGLELHAYF